MAFGWFLGDFWVVLRVLDGFGWFFDAVCFFIITPGMSCFVCLRVVCGAIDNPLK